MDRRLVTATLLATSLVVPGIANAAATPGFQRWEPALHDYLESRFGADARQRFEALEDVLAESADKSVMTRLTAVNDFFNTLPWVDDREQFRQSDYWASMLETVGKYGGDCEDMVLAKYSALLAVGIKPKSLALTYGTVRKGEPHMVLTYAASRGVAPLVLDSLRKDIVPLNRHGGLKPVYAFNRKHLWKLSTRGKPGKRMSAKRLKKWLGWKDAHREMQAETMPHNGGRPMLPAV